MNQQKRKNKNIYLLGYINMPMPIFINIYNI